MTEQDKNILKLYKNINNGILNDEEKTLLLKLFKNVSSEDMKVKISLLKKELKNSNKKDTFITSLVNNEYLFQYRIMQNMLSNFKIKKEKERALKFLHNEKEAEKAGFNAKKQSQQQLDKWVEKAYPNITIDMWESEIDLNFAINYLKVIS